VTSRRREVPWGYVLMLGAVVVVAAGLLVLPGLLSPHPSAAPATSPPAIGDEHEVTTAQGTFRFGYDGNAISIERVEPSPIELGRAVLPDFAQPSFSGVPVAGGGLWALACPGQGAAELIRILFGFENAHPQGPRYDGPPAVGSIADDGLWMFVIDPGPIDPDARISFMTSSGGGGILGSTFDRLLADQENPQPSGCFVSG